MAVTYNLKGTTNSSFGIGKDGPSIHQGTGAPSGGTGIDGDLYIRNDGSTPELYQKKSGTWETYSLTNDVVLRGVATTMTAALTLSGDPTADLHAATKQYVDATASGLDLKESVRVATTANITLSGTQTIDGVTLSIDDRILVKDQTDETENGLYTVESGSWIRTSDADNTPGAEFGPGAFTFVEEGTTNANNGWTAGGTATGSGPLVGYFDLGTDNISWAQFSNAGTILAGTNLNKSGNTLNLDTTVSNIVVQANDGAAGTPSLSFSSDTDTGIFLNTAGNVGFASGGTLIVNMNAGQSAFQVGSVGNPGVSFISDTDTGMFRKATNSLGFSTDGTERVAIDASGNTTFLGNITVTSSADSKLILQGSASPRLVLNSSTSDQYWIDIVGGLRIQNNTDSRTEMQFDGAGNVAIGGGNLTVSNTNPLLIIDDTDGTKSGVMHPAISFRGTGTQVGFVGYNSSTGVMQMFNNGGDLLIEADKDNSDASSKIDFSVDGTIRATIDDSGNVGIGDTLPDSRLHVTGSGAKITIENQNAQQWSIGQSVVVDELTIRDETASQNRLHITSAGDIGIGTTTPGSKLESFTSVAGLSIVSQVRNDNTNSSRVAAIGFNVASSVDADTSVPKAGIGLRRTQSQGRGDLVFYLDAVDDTNAFSAADEVMRLKNTGNLGIGTETPDGRLHVMTSSAGTITAGANDDDLVVESSGNTGMNILSGTANTGNIAFGDSGDANIGLIQYDHFTNSLNITTNAVEAFRVDSAGHIEMNSGNGIYLGGAGAGSSTSANLLDDYEENTFTPVIIGQTVAGSNSYSIQQGRYTKIGNKVHVSIDIRLSSLDGALSGIVAISGLPFTSVSGILQSGTIGFWSNTSTNNVYLGCYINGSSTQIVMSKLAAANVGITQLLGTDLTNDTRFVVSMTYLT